MAPKGDGTDGKRGRRRERSAPAPDPGSLRHALREHGATLVDYSPDPVVIVDEASRIVDANEPALRVYGYERDEFFRLTLDDLRGEAAAVASADQAASTASMIQEEVHRRKGGETFDVVCSRRPLVVDGARYTEIVAHETEGRDEDLRATAMRCWALSRYMTSGYAFCRMVYGDSRPVDFVYLDVNPAFERLTGLKGVVGRHATEVVPSVFADSPEVLEIYGSVATGGEPRTFEDHMSGIDRWFEIAVFSPARDHFVALFSDITAKRRSEEALRAREEDYRLLFETMRQGIVRHDAAGVIREMNPAAARILGVKAEEAISHRWHDPAWPAVRSDGSGYLPDELPTAVALRTGQIVQHEVLGIRQPGADATTWILLDAVPILRPGKDKPNEVYTILADITEKKTVDEALAASERFLDNIIEHSPLALWIADEHGTMLRLNQACRDLLGVEDEQVVGIYNLFGDEVFKLQEHLVRDVRLALQRGETVHFKIAFDASWSRQYGHDHAEPLELEVTISPVVDGDGHVVNAIIQAVDVTERERALRELRESQQELEGLVRTTPTGIFLTHRKDGRLVEANDAFVDMFGLARAEIIGRTTVEIGLFGSVEERARLVNQLGRTGLIKDHEITIRTAQEGERVVLLAGAELERGGVPCIVGTLTDITRRKQAEAELQVLASDLERRVAERTAELQASNADLEAFSYSISHDLRAPLRHMSGYATALIEDYGDTLDETATRYIKALDRSAEEMATLIDELLKFSRAGRAEMLFARVDTNKLVREARESLEEAVAGRDIEWTIPELPDMWGDATLLQQVWLNLLDNAVKYTSTRKQARIIVEVAETPKEYEFVVRDNGVGFEMEYVDKLFGVFQRLHSDRRFEGVGIGLANVRRIVARHGGRTWAEGVPDQGAVFHFTLPRRASA